MSPMVHFSYACLLSHRSVRTIKFVGTIFTFVFWFLPGPGKNINAPTVWTNTLTISDTPVNGIV